MINIETINDINILRKYRETLLNKDDTTSNKKNYSVEVEIILPKDQKYLNDTINFIKPFKFDHSKTFNRIHGDAESIISRITEKDGDDFHLSIETPLVQKPYEKIIRYTN